MNIDNIDQFMDNFEKTNKTKKVKRKVINYNNPSIVIDESIGHYFMIDNDFIDKYAKFVVYSIKTSC